jgi:hypothetical protein
MAKEICTDCSAKLAQPVPFCPSCGRPTRYADDSERLEWDLGQWRAHVDRSIAAGLNPSGVAVGFGAHASAAPAPRARPEPVPPPAPVAKPRIVVAEPERAGWATPAEPDRDDEFAYRACSTCSASDWIVRNGRNDDETWNYWCVRCSRSFKTEIKLPHALKPFVGSGVVLGGLTAASMLLFR